MIDLNDLLALTLVALLWVTIALALRRSLHESDSPLASVDRPATAFRRTDLRNHAVRAWPGL